MPEKFHYQSNKKEIPFNKEKVEDLFLMLNLEKARKLAREHSLEKPEKNVKSAMDITNILGDKMEWGEVISLIKEGKFDGVNIPIDKVKTPKQAQEVSSKLKKHNSKIVSFHGSVDPYFYNWAEKPSSKFVKHDFEMAKILDSNEKTLMNYDLIGADMDTIAEFQKGRSLEEIHRIQRESLAKKEIKSEKNIIESVVSYVGKNRPKDSRRPVVFETRHSIVAESPEATEENLKYFVKTCKKYIGDEKLWGLTVDVGHVLGAFPREPNIENIQKMEKEMEKILKVLEKYKKYIKMIHVSGTVTAHTLASYKLAERANIDPEAIKGWSMHQAIDNQFIVDMVKRIREMKKGEDFVEVSESRPIHSAVKWFGKTLDFDKQQSESVHKEQIKLQTDILGYSKK